MAYEFDPVFRCLRSELARLEDRLQLKADTTTAYSLVTRRPSPFPQHKGHPMDFGSVRIGKTYVSLHLMPIYMSAELTNGMSPVLRKRMQGKSCFNFTTEPDPAVLAELRQLMEASFRRWKKNEWI